jgi:hypothetical protein
MMLDPKVNPRRHQHRGLFAQHLPELLACHIGMVPARMKKKNDLISQLWCWLLLPAAVPGMAHFKHADLAGVSAQLRCQMTAAPDNCDALAAQRPSPHKCKRGRLDRVQR